MPVDHTHLSSFSTQKHGLSSQDYQLISDENQNTTTFDNKKYHDNNNNSCKYALPYAQQSQSASYLYNHSSNQHSVESRNISGRMNNNTFHTPLSQETYSCTQNSNTSQLPLQQSHSCSTYPYKDQQSKNYRLCNQHDGDVDFSQSTFQQRSYAAPYLYGDGHSYSNYQYNAKKLQNYSPSNIESNLNAASNNNDTISSMKSQSQKNGNNDNKTINNEQMKEEAISESFGLPTQWQSEDLDKIDEDNQLTFPMDEDGLTMAAIAIENQNRVEEDKVTNNLSNILTGTNATGHGNNSNSNNNNTKIVLENLSSNNPNNKTTNNNDAANIVERLPLSLARASITTPNEQKDNNNSNVSNNNSSLQQTVTATQSTQQTTTNNHHNQNNNIDDPNNQSNNFGFQNSTAPQTFPFNLPTSQSNMSILGLGNEAQEQLSTSVGNIALSTVTTPVLTPNLRGLTPPSNNIGLVPQTINNVNWTFSQVSRNHPNNQNNMNNMNNIDNNNINYNISNHNHISSHSHSASNNKMPYLTAPTQSQRNYGNNINNNDNVYLQLPSTTYPSQSMNLPFDNNNINSNLNNINTGYPVFPLNHIHGQQQSLGLLSSLPLNTMPNINTINNNNNNANNNNMTNNNQLPFSSKYPYC